MSSFGIFNSVVPSFGWNESTKFVGKSEQFGSAILCSSTSLSGRKNWRKINITLYLVHFLFLSHPFCYFSLPFFFLISLTFSFSLSHPFAVSHSSSLSLSLIHFLSLLLLLSVSLIHFISLSHSLPLSLSFTFSLSLSFTFSLSLIPWQALSLSFFFNTTLSLSITFSLSYYFAHTLFSFLSLKTCRGLSLFEFVNAVKFFRHNFMQSQHFRIGSEVSDEAKQQSFKHIRKTLEALE